MIQERLPLFVNRVVRGILIPASKDLQDHGYSHLLLDDYRGIYLVHACRKSARMSKLNRTRVAIRGVVVKHDGEHPRIFVNSYDSADTYSKFESNLEIGLEHLGGELTTPTSISPGASA